MTGARFAELKRMKWDESSIKFGIKLKSTKTGGRWRTIAVPDAARLIAKRQQALGGPPRVLTAEYEYFSDTFKVVSESLNIPYGQRVQNGWTIHDLRHTCLTNMALEGIPLHAIKEFAGHRNISETIRYLKDMPTDGARRTDFIETRPTSRSRIRLTLAQKTKRSRVSQMQAHLHCQNTNAS